MLDNPTSLAILGSIISIGGYLVYRFDVWGKKSGWLEDER